MRYASIESILPQLKILTGRNDMNQFIPEMARWVGFVEYHLGLHENALHRKEVFNIPVVRGQAPLEVGFYKEIQLLDCCLDPCVVGLRDCTCGCVPCHCGYQFYRFGYGNFQFHDNVLDCPFNDGTISYAYWSLEIGRDGLPMILESHVEAFCSYVTKMFKKGEMNSNRASVQVYRENKMDWENDALITRSRDNVPKKHEVRMASIITGAPYKYLLH